MNKLFFGLALLFSIVSYAQNVRLEGTIKDSTGTALEMANIMAVNKATNAMESYAITDDAGRYQLSLKANTAYTLKASYIGFTPLEGAQNTDTYVLQSQVEAIREVRQCRNRFGGSCSIGGGESFANAGKAPRHIEG